MGGPGSWESNSSDGVRREKKFFQQQKLAQAESNLNHFKMTVLLSLKLDKTKSLYCYQERMQNWGQAVGLREVRNFRDGLNQQKFKYNSIL